jgi:hypothetical protein
VTDNAPLPAEETIYIRTRLPDPEINDIRAPDQSANRACLSSPRALLYGEYSAQSVAECLVADVPASIAVPDGGSSDFRVIPDPIDEPRHGHPKNPSHCEIRAFVGGVRQDKVTRGVSKRFRAMLAGALKPVPAGELDRPPTPPPQPPPLPTES